MDYVQDGSTSIYHDTVSVGGGGVHPQRPSSLLGQVRDDSLGNPDTVLQVSISNAECDTDRVTFTVLTVTNLPEFSQRECVTNRTHDEFVWLHDYFTESPDFAGYIIPPAPLKPNFDASRAKLQRLGESENQLPKEDLQTLRGEIEASSNASASSIEYLVTFKKTVAMHALFLQRLAAHEVFRRAPNLQVFLEYQGSLCVRNKTRKEKASDFIKSVHKTADEHIFLHGQRDEDPFFREEKFTLSAYHTALKDATAASDAATKQRKAVTDQFLAVHMALDSVVPKECLYYKETDLFAVLSSFFENYKKTLVRVACDEDFKLSDSLRYCASDAGAANDMLYRRIRALADYENANKALDKARSKQKSVSAAEDAQFAANDRFKSLSDSARHELEDFKFRRVKYFHENLTELAEIMITRAKAQTEVIESALTQLKAVQVPSLAPQDGAGNSSETTGH